MDIPTFISPYITAFNISFNNATSKTINYILDKNVAELNVHKCVMYTLFYISRFNPLINSAVLFRSREEGEMPFGKYFPPPESLLCHTSEICDMMRYDVDLIKLPFCCRLPVLQILCSKCSPSVTQI
jgi:hypothetical protein